MNFSITRANGGVIAWTDDQVAYIINEYKNGSSLKELGRKFNCSYGTIKNLLHNKRIKTDGCKHDYPRNSNYFNSIDTPAKAYWLGVMYSDGCCGKRNNEVKLSLKDRDHVEKFKMALEAVNHKISVSKDTRFNEDKFCYSFMVKDQQLHSDLVKWGCVPNKTYVDLIIPNIPRNFTSHFIRGVFDGDGSLHYIKSTDNYRISFCSLSEKFLQEIKKELGLNPNLKIGHSKRERDHSYQLQISGWKQVGSVLDYLYNESNESIRLNRKYEIYQNYLQWAHRYRTKKS